VSEDQPSKPHLSGPAKRAREKIEKFKANREDRAKQSPEEILEDLRGLGLERASFKDPLTGKQRSVWEMIKHYYRYRGKEWQIEIPDDLMRRFDELSISPRGRNATRLRNQAAKTYRELLASHIRNHLDSHPDLKKKIITNEEDLHYFVVCVAFQLWAKDEDYAKWLMENVLKPVTHSTPDWQKHLLFGAWRDRHYAWLDSDDLDHEGYIYFVEEVIPKGVYAVQASLKKYWQWCVRNFINDLLRRKKGSRNQPTALLSLGAAGERELWSGGQVGLVDPRSYDAAHNTVVQWIADNLHNELPSHLQRLLLRRFAIPDGERFPSNRRIAKEWDKDEKTIRNWSAELEQFARQRGVIEKVRRLLEARRLVSHSSPTVVGRPIR